MTIDYGFEMPDTRATYWLEDVPITVVIRRDWFPTEYGEMDYRCSYDVKVDGKFEVNFDRESKAMAYVEAAYPSAEREEECREY
jgi:hypothetical protein